MFPYLGLENVGQRYGHSILERSFKAKGLCAESAQGFGQLAGQVLAGPHGHDGIVDLFRRFCLLFRRAIAQHEVTQRIVFQERHDAGPQERRLADPEAAVEQDQPAVRLVEKTGETSDVPIASGQERPIFTIQRGERLVRLFRQGIQ